VIRLQGDYLRHTLERMANLNRRWLDLAARTWPFAQPDWPVGQPWSPVAAPSAARINQALPTRRRLLSVSISSQNGSLIGSSSSAAPLVRARKSTGQYRSGRYRRRRSHAGR